MTRTEIETIVIRRLRRLMLAAGLNVNPTGDNLDMDDPLQSALTAMEYASSTSPTTEQIEAVTAADLSEYLLRAQVATLENILGNIEGSDVSMTTGKQELRSQLVSQVLQMLEYSRAQLDTATGGNTESGGGGTLTGGTVALDFQASLGDFE